MKKISLLTLTIALVAVHSLFAVTGMDFNGDGKADLVNVWGDAVDSQMNASVFLSDGTSFSKEDWAVDQGDHDDLQRWFYGDFDGDGDTDIAKLWDDAGTMSCEVHLATNAQFEVGFSISNACTFAYTDKWISGDFNGDGLTDLARGYDNGGRSFDVILSNGSGFDPVATWGTGQGGSFAQQFWLNGDYDGDGMSDVMVITGTTQMVAEVHLSNGSGFDIQTWATNQGSKTSRMKWLSEDFDGDGKTDIAKLWWNDNNISIDVHRSTGSALTLEGWVTDQNIGFDRNDLWVKGDFNGDGLVDIARLKEDNELLSMDVFHSTSNSFVYTNAMTQAVAYRDQSTYMVGDYTGDGSTDIVACWSDGAQVFFDVINPAAGSVASFGALAQGSYFQSEPVQETIFGDTFINYGQIEGAVPNTVNLQTVMDAGNDLYLQQNAIYELPYTLTYKRDYQRIETHNTLFMNDYAKCLHVMDGTNEVDSTISARANTDYVTLRNVIVDGNRYGGLPIKIRDGLTNEGSMIAFGVGDGHVLRRVVLLSSRTWSSCQIHESENSTDNLIEHNWVLGAGNSPRGSGRSINEDPRISGKVGWGDGFSVSGISTTVRRNFIMDGTDVGCVVFCAPGTEVYENMIFNMSRECLGAINMVDGIDAYQIGANKWTYQGTTVRDNIISAYGARIQMGIPHSSKAWNGRTGKVFAGATIKDNHLMGGAFGYGYVLGDLEGVTVTGNTSDATHTGKANESTAPTAQPFFYAPSTIDGTSQVQSDFVSIGGMKRLLFQKGGVTAPFNSDGYQYYAYTSAEARAIVEASYLEMLGRQPTAQELTDGKNFFLNNNKKYGDLLKRQLMGTAEFISKFGAIDPNGNGLHPFRVARWMDILNRLDSEELKSTGNFSDAQQIFDPALAALEYISNDSTFISWDAPTSIPVDSSFDVTVTMRNDGPDPWTYSGPGNGISLGSDAIGIDRTDEPGAIITSQYTDSPAGEGDAQLFDNDAGTKYLTFNASTWIQHQFGGGNQYVIEKYSLTSANDAEERDPLDWTLQGSNNGTDWTTIDTRNGVDFPGRFQKIEFTAANSTAYEYHRLNMTNNSGSIFQLSEVELFTSAVNTWSSESRIPVTGSIAPGAQETFVISATSPSEEGFYNFQWQMIDEPSAWFGASTPDQLIEVVASLGPDAAQIVSQVVPTVVEPGESFNAELTFRNSGTTTWTSGAGYQLASVDPLDNTVWGATTRTSVSGTVAPGETHIFTISCTAPLMDGTYDFRRKMIQEGGFGLFGETANATVSVVAVKPVGLVDRTDEPGAIISANVSSINAVNAFDNDLNTKYETTNSSAQVQHQFADENKYTVKWYTVASASDVPETLLVNLFGDSSFEVNDGSWTLGGSGSFSTAQAYAGSTSLRVVNYAGGTTQQEKTNLQAGKTYQVVAWIHTLGVTAGKAVLDTSDEYDDTCQFAAGEVHGWTKYTGRFTAVDNSVKIRLFTTEDFVGTAYFDSVTVREVVTDLAAADDMEPASWTLQGSNDGSNWTAVDTRSGIDFSALGEVLEFSALQNQTAYEYYRFDADCRDGDALCFAEVELFGPENDGVGGYDAWAVTEGIIGGQLDDDDGDGLDNLSEYAVGEKPIITKSDSIFNYVYKQRTDDPNLAYELQTCTDLVSGSWANTGYTVLGTNVTGGVYDDVTNSIPADAPQSYIRLKIIDQ